MDERNPASTPGHDITGADLPRFQEVNSAEALRVITDPLRRRLRRLLVEGEYTVKELGDLVGEDPTRRLYYHVSELERTGFVRLMRTEVVSGIAQKYYRAVAKDLIVPTRLLQDDHDSDEAHAIIDFYISRIDQAAVAFRSFLLERPLDFELDQGAWSSRWIRTSPEEAEELHRRLNDLMRFMDQIDQPEGTEQLQVLLMAFPDESRGAGEAVSTPLRTPANVPARRRTPSARQSATDSNDRRAAN